jgi:hypothetical protein
MLVIAHILRKVKISNCKMFFLGNNITSSPLAVRSMQHLGFLQDTFPGITIPSYFLSASNTHFLQVVLNIG